MPSTYSPILGIELIAPGEQNNTWGYTTNSNLGTLVEQAIAGQADIVMTTSSHTLTDLDGSSDEARCMIINVSGVLAATGTIICPAVTKMYIVVNNTSGGHDIEFRTASGSGTLIPNGFSKVVYCDGTDVYEGVTAAETLLLGSDPTPGTLEAATANYVDNAIAPFYSLTPSKALASDVSGGIAASITSATELSYLSGASSNIQTQLNAKAPSTSGTSILMGNGSGGFTSAVAKTNYAPPTSGSSAQLLANDGVGGFNNVTITPSQLSYGGGALGLTPVITAGSANSANITFDQYGRILSATDGGGAGVSKLYSNSPILVGGGTGPASGEVTITLSTVPVDKGGTGATNAASALTNLGALSTSGTAYDSARLGGVLASNYPTASSGTAYNASNLGGYSAASYLLSSTAATTYVSTSGTQTISGTKTFSSTIIGSITGSAGSAGTAGSATTASFASELSQNSGTYKLACQTDGNTVFYSSGTPVWSVTQAGAGIYKNMTLTNLAIATGYAVALYGGTATNGALCTVSSSGKYKNILGDYDKGLNELLMLTPKYFKYKPTEATIEAGWDPAPTAGLIAEEVQELGFSEFTLLRDGEPDTVLYDNMVALFINAIKDLNAKIEALEAKVG